MSFKEYLKIYKSFTPKTIHDYCRFAALLLQWLKEENLEAETATYNDLLRFIKNLHKEGRTKHYINGILAGIRHYFNYLKQQNRVKVNIATGLYVKGVTRRIPHDLFTTQQLEEIYNGYTTKGLSGRRNKVMLGLMIYQAVKTEELEKLLPGHLKLREGKIYIPSSKRTNSRILKLESHQIIDLQEYITKTRELIIALTEKESEKLFVSIGGSSTLHGSLDKFMRRLRKQHNYFKNAEQIRQSVISNWIKLHDIRQVQYMIGHKYVSSTERYQADDLQDLQKELSKHHPLQ